MLSGALLYAATRGLGMLPAEWQPLAQTIAQHMLQLFDAIKSWTVAFLQGVFG